MWEKGNESINEQMRKEQMRKFLKKEFGIINNKKTFLRSCQKAEIRTPKI